PSGPATVELSKQREVVHANASDEPSLDGAWSAFITVIDALGAPVANARLDLSAAQKGRTLRSVLTDSFGHAILTVCEDCAFVRAYHQDVGRSIAVDVVDQGRFGTRLMLARPASMTALVLDQRHQPVAGQRVRVVNTAGHRFHGSTVVFPSTVTTDVNGRFAFEAFVGLRVTMGSDPRNAFVAHDGGEVVSTLSERLDSRDGVVEWYYGRDWDADALGQWISSGWTTILPERDQEPFWIEVLRAGGAPVPDAGLHWIEPGRDTPKHFYAESRDRNRFRLHVHEVKRKPARLLVRGPEGYSQSVTFEPGRLPTSIAVVLQPPGDVHVQVLHRGRRARGVHTELTSWGKRAEAQLDAEGIARYTMVHHGPMNVRVMRGPEVLATRQVHVPIAGTAHAAAHVDLSR
ncbi:MAG: protocatechuate 3,4-dioxygenase beta subunit, partial [Planctomycetota bacterium]